MTSEHEYHFDEAVLSVDLGVQASTPVVLQAVNISGLPGAVSERCETEDFLVQSPWPDSDILVDGQVAQVRSGIFHVGLSEGRLHEITPKENLRA